MALSNVTLVFRTRDPYTVLYMEWRFSLAGESDDLFSTLHSAFVPNIKTASLRHDAEDKNLRHDLIERGLTFQRQRLGEPYMIFQM
jgi:hypothetical protein